MKSGRKPLAQEVQTRDVVKETILENVLTDKLVYPFPPAMVEILKSKRVIVTRQYIVRRYEEMGIEYKKGLWVKMLEQKGERP